MGVSDYEFDRYWLEAGPVTEREFSWWCFLHNIDIAMTLHALATMCYDKGFDAGIVIGSLSQVIKEDVRIEPMERLPRARNRGGFN